MLMSNDSCECHTVCKVSDKCITPKPPPSSGLTLEELLDLIAKKCDKTVCSKLSCEVGMLYKLLDEDRDTICGDIVKPGKGYQLVKNMVDSLKGDLKDKYPSAELLKKQLAELWSCLNDSHKHHGDWKDNFTWRSIVAEDNACIEDNAPTRIKVITPIDVGSTVFHIVNGKRCLFESLVNNNVIEPTRVSVLEGKWLNYCDLKDVIDCVLPRRISTCKEDCNTDGVVDLQTLCEQIAHINTRLDELERRS